MSRLTRATTLARQCVRHISLQPPRAPSSLVAAAPIRCPVVSGPSPCSTVRYRSTSTKPAAVEPVEEAVENQGAADLFDEIELDGEEWEGEEIEEGVFVSVPPPDPATARPARPQTTSIKHLNRLLSRHQVPDIPEDELEERFVRGRGPGGQAINKTNSSVSLIHLPTGIRVQSQPTRSRPQNRIIARQILKERLDLMRARGELDVAPGDEKPAADKDKGKATTEEAKPPQNRKERLAAEARLWSKQELRWEKERRRKANRAKKVKRRKSEDGEGEGEGEGEGDEGK